MLTKRKFLVAAGTAAVVLPRGLEYLVSEIFQFSSALAQERTITFEQALQDSNLREPYVHKLLKQSLGQGLQNYFENVHYDEDGSKIKEMGGVPSGHMATASQIDNFGKKIKSDLYVSGEIFKPYDVSINNLTITIPPTEKKIIAQSRHEMVHAKDIYEGITLEDGSVINNAVFLAMTPIVRDFVMETRGYIKQVEESRNLERAMPITPSTDLTKVPPAYLSSMRDFI